MHALNWVNLFIIWVVLGAIVLGLALWICSAGAFFSLWLSRDRVHRAGWCDGVRSPSQVLVNDNVIEPIIRFFDVGKFTGPAENPNLWFDLATWLLFPACLQRGDTVVSRHFWISRYEPGERLIGVFSSEIDVVPSGLVVTETTKPRTSTFCLRNE
jgi:hypothetical protein